MVFIRKKLFKNQYLDLQYGSIKRFNSKVYLPFVSFLLIKTNSILFDQIPLNKIDP
jgi:hypothetical protein